MGPRPAHLNLGNARPEAFVPPPKMWSPRDMPSPKTGEVPPALSPLDALAMHSRMLAQRFHEERPDGRRMSRLPPSVVDSEMKRRPDYFRSLSAESGRMSEVAEGNEEASPVSQHGQIPEAATPSKDRPVSHYPRLSNVKVQDDDAPAMPTPFFDAPEHPHSHGQVSPPKDYFDLGVVRATSPEPVDKRLVNVQAPSPNDFPSLTSSIDTISSHPRTMTNDSTRSQRSITSDRGFGLAPPQSPRYPKSPRSFQSIRSVPPDSSDEDGLSTNGSHALSSSRKFSGSSGMSRPQSPYSPWMRPVHRSPSMTSEYSMNGSQQLQRPAANFSNFSRPMSSAGSRPSFDTRPSFDSRSSSERIPPSLLPQRQTSGASHSTEQSFKPSFSRHGSDDDTETFPALETPSMPEQEFSGEHSTTPNGSSYIYAKYKLPRGRPVDRDSQAFRDSWIQKQFEWDRVHDTQSGRKTPDAGAVVAAAQDLRAAPDAERIGRSLTPIISDSRSRSADPRGSDKAPALHRSSPSVKTDSTDRTITASLHQKSASADLSAEEHLEVGISSHNAGETNKSTYHLRLAAIAGLPHAMLLYGLACRHGWGMRKNEVDGYNWIKKAVDIAGLDVAEAEEKLGTNKIIDPQERKKRVAQYALAIYELGNSCMRGWGCAKDKPAAVRYYEAAGDLGDVDALVEAAYCYVEGVGCKKDLRKGASLYRRAAEKGVSVAGQSWIYKPKYMDEPTPSEKELKRPDTAVSSRESKKDEKTPTASSNRSRSKSIFGRKKERLSPMPALPTTSS